MKITKWDMAENIITPEDVTAYLSAALEAGEAADVINVIGAIARSKGMTKLAREAGVTREALYTSLSPNGNPYFIAVVFCKRFSVNGVPLPPFSVFGSKVTGTDSFAHIAYKVLLSEADADSPALYDASLELAEVPQPIKTYPVFVNVLSGTVNL